MIDRETAAHRNNIFNGQSSKEESSEPEPYRHIPKVAAIDFMKSTTQDSMPFDNSKVREINGHGHHVFAHAALHEQAKAAYHEPNAILTFTVARSKAEDQARTQRQAVSERNQFQRDQVLEEAAQYDRDRDIYAPVRRSFGVDPLNVIISGSKTRPLSSSEANWEDGGRRSTDAPSRLRRTVPNVNDHLDWAQRDDTPVEHSSIRDRLSPLLKKTESKWILRKKDARDDSVSGYGLLCPTGHNTAKVKRGSFLGRFKRDSKEAEI